MWKKRTLRWGWDDDWGWGWDWGWERDPGWGSTLFSMHAQSRKGGPRQASAMLLPNAPWPCCPDGVSAGGVCLRSAFVRPPVLACGGLLGCGWGVQSEYKLGVSGWNFNVEDLKKQAATVRTRTGAPRGHG